METPFALTREQSRRVDKVAVEQYGIPSVVLMENAGRGVVDALLQIDPSLSEAQDDDRPRVAILCGKGNNAGDGLVIARHLAIRGVIAKVLLLCPPDDFRGDALINYRILAHANAPIVELSQELARNEGRDDTAKLFDQHAADVDWLVDAMLGTGAVGEPRSPFDAAIEWMNEQAARRLAVDVPSGLDCDAGAPAATTVHADVTCTFVANKIGFSQPAAQPFLGEVHVVSIGAPPSLIHELLAESHS